MGRTIFITGTNRGIGNSILREFCKEQGVTILAHTRKKTPEFEQETKELQAEFDCRILPVFFDLCDEDGIRNSVKTVLQECRQIDVLVNNAGIMRQGSSFMMTPLSEIKRTVQINFFAQVLLTQMVVKAMIRNKGGSIINMTSMAALDGTAGQFEYTCSKSAMIGMTLRLSHELAPFGIRCNAIAPGLIRTDMMDYLTPPLEKTLSERVFIGRMGMPEEIASVAVFLASSAASYINGQVLCVDGGSGRYN